MKLYAAPMACSWAVQIVLEKARIPYETDWLRPGWALAGGGHLVDVNPRRQFPTLDLGDGQIFTETMVLLQIAADRAPEAGLIPPVGTMPRYRVLEMLSYLGSEVHKHTLWPLANLVSYPGDHEALAEMFQDRLRSRLDYLEGRCPEAGFFMGPRFGVVDAMLAVMLYWGERRSGSLAGWPRLAAYHARLKQDPEVERTFATNREEQDLLARAGLPV